MRVPLSSPYFFLPPSSKADWRQKKDRKRAMPVICDFSWSSFILNLLFKSTPDFFFYSILKAQRTTIRWPSSFLSVHIWSPSSLTRELEWRRSWLLGADCVSFLVAADLDQIFNGHCRSFILYAFVNADKKKNGGSTLPFPTWPQKLCAVSNPASIKDNSLDPHYQDQIRNTTDMRGLSDAENKRW